MTTRLAFACYIAALSPLLVMAEAQVIRVKTIPVAESEQFAFLPSAGMASVSIALPDTLADPFNNPAKLSRMRGSQFFGAPSFYSVSGNSSAGATFPVGALWQKGATYGGLGAATQRIDRANENVFFSPGIFLDGATIQAPRTPQSQKNNYAFAMLGHRLDSARLSLAASVLWSGLDVVEGVDQFYIDTEWLRQKGEALDLRLGVLKEWAGGQSFEAVVLRNRLGHEHDVGFTDLFWDPATRSVGTQSRAEHNADRSNTWGLHLEYERPLADSGWRIGALLTGNRISHPRIPNYVILTGMGNEGRSSAFNVGVGVAKSHGPVAYGVDAIYEPITSRTWVTDSLDNRFRFSNARVRAGVSRTFQLMAPTSSLRFQLGAELYSIHYVLNQHDLVQDLRRVRKETWLERTRTAGMSLQFPGIEMHYHLRSKSGIGRPGVVPDMGGVVFGPETNRVTIAPGPWSPPVNDAATLGAVRVTWHQFTISFPRR